MELFNSCCSFLYVACQAIRMDLKEVAGNLFKAIYLIIIVFVAYQVLRAVLGGTWATENIIIAGMGIILAGMFAIAGFLINQGKSMGILEERTKNIGASLSNLGMDFKQHLKKKL